MANKCCSCSLAEHRANIAGTGSGTAFANRLNGNNFFEPNATVVDDDAADTLIGGLGPDWFIFAADDLVLDCLALLGDVKNFSDAPAGPGLPLGTVSGSPGLPLGNSSSHDNNNLPILLAGGGFKHQGHLAYDRKNNMLLANLFVRMLQQMEIESHSFGASTSVLSDV